MAARCIVIPAEGDIESREFNSYEDYRDAVGGYIELVPGAYDGTAMYVNEDGISLGLPPNPRASQLVRLFPGDYIKGTAVLFGTHRIGVDGEEADCPLTIEDVKRMTQTADYGGGKIR